MFPEAEVRACRRARPNYARRRACDHQRNPSSGIRRPSSLLVRRGNGSRAEPRLSHLLQPGHLRRPGAADRQRNLLLLFRPDRRRCAGRVLVLFGNLNVTGRIEGSATVIGGNTVIDSQARIGGSALVVGGNAVYETDDSISGNAWVVGGHLSPISHRHRSRSPALLQSSSLLGMPRLSRFSCFRCSSCRGAGPTLPDPPIGASEKGRPRGLQSRGLSARTRDLVLEGIELLETLLLLVRARGLVAVVERWLRILLAIGSSLRRLCWLSSLEPRHSPHPEPLPASRSEAGSRCSSVPQASGRRWDRSGPEPGRSHPASEPQRPWSCCHRSGAAAAGCAVVGTFVIRCAGRRHPRPRPEYPAAATELQASRAPQQRGPPPPSRRRGGCQQRHWEGSLPEPRFRLPPGSAHLHNPAGSPGRPPEPASASRPPEAAHPSEQPARCPDVAGSSISRDPARRYCPRLFSRAALAAACSGVGVGIGRFIAASRSRASSTCGEAECSSATFR